VPETSSYMLHEIPIGINHRARDPPRRSMILHTARMRDGVLCQEGLRIPLFTHDQQENRGRCKIACQDYAFNEPNFLNTFFPATRFKMIISNSTLFF